MKKITYQQAKHLKQEAAKDNIKVTIKIFDKTPFLAIGKCVYKMFEGALQDVRFRQSQIVDLGVR